MDGEARKEEARKRKLPEMEEGKDYEAEAPLWTASKRQKPQTTDLAEGELCVAGGSTQTPAKRPTR